MFLSSKTIEYHTSIVGYIEIALRESAVVHCVPGQRSMLLPDVMEQCITLAILFRTVGTVEARRHIHTFVPNVTQHMLFAHIISSANIAIKSSIDRILKIICARIENNSQEILRVQNKSRTKENRRRRRGRRNRTI